MVLGLWSFTAFHLHGHGEHGTHGASQNPPTVVEAWGDPTPKQRPLLRPLDESCLDFFGKKNI